MSKRNPSLQQLRQEIADLQKQINLKEEELNIEIGAWIRKQTNLDSLQDIQQNFRLVPINNNPQKSSINTHTTALSSADLTPKSAC
mgnify:CR=1 FL=1